MGFVFSGHKLAKSGLEERSDSKDFKEATEGKGAASGELQHSSSGNGIPTWPLPLILVDFIGQLEKYLFARR